jgi:murein DD-endopeptidase MepM/ murein hydrolase activator NlpD
MARTVYRYNQETCRYDPEFRNGRHVIRDTVLFLAASSILGAVGFLFVMDQSTSLSEGVLEKKNEILQSEWTILDSRITQANNQLTKLIEKDDYNYRVILDSQPLESSIREAGVGGSEKTDLREVVSFPSIYTDYKRLDKLARQVDIEVQSFHEIQQLLEAKMKIWSSRPAIQPIDNQQLDRLHLTYGPRMHPIFHVMMLHKGLDFTASEGTPVYATGDGKIGKAYFSDSYGRVIFVEHGHGFETRYAHLSRFNVRPGDIVKRGQVIGYVGSTGHSVSSHLHYEVLYNGEHINPINFFQRDLSNKEYEKLIQVGSRQSAPLD